MTVDDLRKFRNAQPFRPFQLVLSDGRKLLVTHPERIGWSPSGRSVGVYTRGDSGAILEIDRIVKVQTPRSRNGKQAK